MPGKQTRANIGSSLPPQRTGKGKKLNSAAKSHGLEKELKYFLTKQDYQKLLSACKKHVGKTVRQTNFYFDDPALKLRKKRIGFRIRLVDQKRAVVTLKHPAKGFVPKVPSLKVRHEYEEEIPLKLAKAVLKGKKHILDVDAAPVEILKTFFSKGYLKRLKPLGSVDTIRTFVRPKRSLELELDRFKMFKQKFYELEVETTNPRLADKEVRALLQKCGIPYLPTTKSKLGRFIDEWKRLNA